MRIKLNAIDGSEFYKINLQFYDSDEKTTLPHQYPLTKMEIFWLFTSKY